MAKKILFQKYFNGGISESEKEGIQGSFYFGQKLNIFGDPSQATILPKSAKDSSTTVVDLIKWIVNGSPHNTSTYFYGDTGHIYRRTEDGTWSDLQTTANSNGQGMDVYNDYLYYMQNLQLGRYGPISTSPTFTDAFQTGLTDTINTGFAPVKAFNGYLYAGHGNKLLQTDGTTTTIAKLTLPSGLNIRSLEVIDEYLVLACWRGRTITQNEEGYVFFWDGVSVNYNFFTKVEEGGANAVLNTRNRLLSVLGSIGFVYLNYAPFQRVQQLPKLTSGKYVEVFPGAVTVWRGQALIGFAGRTNSTDIYHGVYQYASRSEKYPEVLNYGFPISTGETNGISPRSMGAYSPDTASSDNSVGTIAWVNPTNVVSANATFATAALAADEITEYLKVTDFDFDLPTGATIEGIEVEVLRKESGTGNNISDNRVRIVKGGAIGATDRAKTEEYPTTQAYAIYGHAKDLWGETWTVADIEATTFGVAISAKSVAGDGTGSASIDHVRITVYYTESTDNVLQIGAIKGIGNNLFIGWRNDTTYGVDKVASDAVPYTTGTLEALIFDDRRNGEDKLAFTIKATHLALVSGESMQLGYKQNRDTNYTTGDANTEVGSTETRLPVPFTDSRFKEFQFEAILGANSTTTPTLTSLSLEYDDNKEEKDF